MPAPASIPSTDVMGRRGDEYLISDADRQTYRERGYIALPNVLREDEVQAIEAIYDRFSSGAIPGMGRDLCDMSGSYDDLFANFSLINAMLPRVYLPALQGNIFERISASIARQLLGPDMILDYDQFLSKKPKCARGICHAPRHGLLADQYP
jgi:phytanoyl-CoA hydroxylase